MRGLPSSIEKSCFAPPKRFRVPVCGDVRIVRIGARHRRAGRFLTSIRLYAPVSRTANFTSYTASRFGEDDQTRLQQLVIDVARRGSTCCSATLRRRRSPRCTNITATCTRRFSAPSGCPRGAPSTATHRGAAASRSTDYEYWRLRAGEPDQLTTLRARVHHAEVAHEGYEAARAMICARRTNRGRRRFDRRHAQQAPCLGHGMVSAPVWCRDTRGSPSSPACQRNRPLKGSVCEVILAADGSIGMSCAKVAELADAPDLGSGG